MSRHTSEFVNIAASSGGPSTCATLDAIGNCLNGYAKPVWQTGTGVPADGLRDLPDISLFSGDGVTTSFYIVCQADQVNGSSCDLNAPFNDFTGAGGTSISAQVFAGVMALVNQEMQNAGLNSRQGNANFVLYKLAAQSGASCNSSTAALTNSSCIFYDITKGNNSVPCVAGSPNCNNNDQVLVNPAGSTSPAFPTNAGYDLATGLGSVNVSNLVTQWHTQASFSPTTTTVSNLSPLPTTITHGQQVSMNITVAAQGGGGTPSGVVSLIGGPSGTASIDGFGLTNGAVAATTSLLPGGTYNVTAHYGGDPTFAPSDSAGFPVTVNKESSQTRLGIVTFDIAGNVLNTNAPTAAYGSPYLLRVDILNSKGATCSPNPLGEAACPSGGVSLTDNGAPLDQGTYSLNSAGFLEDQLIQLGTGAHSLLATYGGDNSFTGSTSSADNVSITQAATAMSTPVPTPSAVAINATFDVTSTVTTQSSGVAPTGSVTFLANGNPLPGTVTYTPTAGGINGNAALAADLKTSLSTTGNIAITASYSGDVNYMASSSTAANVDVSLTGPDFAVSASAITISAPGQQGTSTVTVSPSNGFTGAVTLSCTVPATMRETTCLLSQPNPVQITGSSNVNSTLTVKTTAPHPVVAFLPGKLRPALSGETLVVLGLALGAAGKRRRVRGLLVLLVLSCVVLGILACGGGSSGGGTTTDPGTAPGTYTVVVTAASGNTTNTTNVSVTVQ